MISSSVFEFMVKTRTRLDHDVDDDVFELCLLLESLNEDNFRNNVSRHKRQVTNQGAAVCALHGA